VRGAVSGFMKTAGVPQVAVPRLAGYLRLLRRLHSQGVGTTSSAEMADLTGANAAQIRKDLSYFGEFGVRGVGYDVRLLISELSRCLGLDRERSMVILGAGQSGPALARHGGFADDGFRCVGVFDIGDSAVGQQVGELTVRPMGEAVEAMRERGAQIAVVAVPAESAAEVAALSVAAGVRGILNLTPARLPAFSGVFVHQVDLSVELTLVSFYLSHDSPPRSDATAAA
jgi:redox-sensing transcriptional repressor